MAAGKDETDLFMSVRLDDGRRICKVSVSSQTTGENVIELLKPDDDNVYYLVEIWKGCERPIAHEEKLKNVLLQWGSDLEDVVFMLKRKNSSSRQKQTKSSQNSPVPDQLQDKQQKVENLEKEVQQKEKHLKSLRSKETSKNNLKTKYVKLLESRVIEQEEKLLNLQSVQDELFKTRLDNEKLVVELSRLRSMFVLKHQQLADATARVEMLNRALAKSSQQNGISKDSASTNERIAQHPQYSQPNTQSDMYQKQLLNQQYLTEAQLLQLQANNGYPTGTLNHNGQLGKDILFLRHGILQERGDLNSLLSWQNDEENDTETSADSGHVSNDSPSYQNRLGPNFQFYPNPPDMYCAKVERFDIDQEFGSQLNGNQGGVGPQGLKGMSEVDGWSKSLGRYPSPTNGSAFNPAIQPPGNANPTQQLFVNTDVKQGGVGQFLRQQQVNRDSPQSTSSLSSMSSESSRNDPSSFPGSHPIRMGPQANPSSSATPNDDMRNIKSHRDSGSRSTTPTNERRPSTSSESSSNANRRNSGSKTNTPTTEYKPFIPNESTSDARQNSNRRNSGSKTNTPTTEHKPFIPNESTSDGSNTNRTAGSISHYHRNSLDNSSRLTLGAFIKDRSPSQTSDSSSENSSHRARTPSLEKPVVPKSLTIPKGNDTRNGHLSPTVTESNTGTNFNHSNKVKSDSPTIKTRPMPQGGSVVQNGRSSPMVLDLAAQNTKNPTQQNINRKKSPLSTERLIPGSNDPKGRSSPAIFDPKSTSSDRALGTNHRSSPKVVDAKGPTSDRRFDPKGRTSPWVSEPRGETSASTTSSRPDKGSLNQPPLSSPGVEELLNDMNSLKVTAREVKPIQIQTRAEKDSDNIPVEKATVKTNISAADTKLPSDSQSKRVHKPPKPVPRKRTKTPPARGSGSETNLVVTSSQETMVTKSNGKNAKDGGKSKASESQVQSTEKLSDGVGTKAYDSILRSSKKKGGKKSGKRVSLDPHAVLLHASLEGELELVKNIIHQVEDPSYPNNEGLTALHHSVCNSHDDIVKFLIEYGCDINAADMQGWTSLHCAAANNSIEMCKFLINHGACVFAVTAIEGKTPSRCCEKESANFEQCFTYLTEIENNFGITNDGVVYAVYAYQATRKDELSFECGERLKVVRRGDVTEKEWWWARGTRNQFGYIPRNLLGLHPPVAPDV